MESTLSGSEVTLHRLHLALTREFQRQFQIKENNFLSKVSKKQAQDESQIRVKARELIIRPFFFFKFRQNLHNTKSTTLKCTLQWHLILCNYHLYQVPKHQYHPKRKPCTHSAVTPWSQDLELKGRSDTVRSVHKRSKLSIMSGRNFALLLHPCILSIAEAMLNDWEPNWVAQQRTWLVTKPVKY